MKLVHKIGDIYFSIESNIDFELYKNKQFDFFFGEGFSPSIKFFIKKVDDTYQKSISSSIKSTKKLKKTKNKSYILNNKSIKNIIKKYVDSHDLLDIRSDQNQVIIRNFSQNEIHVFYNDMFWGYDPINKRSNADFRIYAEIKELYSTFLPIFSAILVHSSGVILNDRAAIFLASSGGGKSTVISNYQGNKILNDDQIILKKVKSDFFAFSTPLGRITSGSLSAKLSGFFLLEKSDRFSLEVEKSEKLLEYLWSTQASNSVSLPREIRSQMFQFLYDISRNIPVYKLSFPKDYINWDAIDRALKK